MDGLPFDSLLTIQVIILETELHLLIITVCCNKLLVGPFFVHRGMVYALSFGDTFILGLIGGVHCEEWGRAITKTSSSSSRLAQMLTIYMCLLGLRLITTKYGWFIIFKWRFFDQPSVQAYTLFFSFFQRIGIC